MSDQMSPADVIVLPRLDAASAATLGAALQTEAASVKKLPVAVKRALTPLATTTMTLHGVLRGRLGTAVKPSLTPLVADRTVDDAVGVMYGWMQMLARLPEEFPEGAMARAWLRELFPDGIKFINASYNREWTEIETRLTKLTASGYDKQIIACGGKSLLTYLTQAHKVYGEALGITAPRATAQVQESAALRDALTAQLQSLRFYVLRVLAAVEPDEPDTAALASCLLRPLNEWKSRPAKPAAEVTPEEPAPTPDPAA